jgi:hypothetical protein
MASGGWVINCRSEALVDLGNMRYVSVRSSNRGMLIDIREYFKDPLAYYDDKKKDQLKPTKQGITLTMEQWENLKKQLKDVDNLCG